MMAKSPTGKELAAKLCRKFPDTPSRTLARRLFNENKERFPNLESARKSILYVRGRNGKLTASFALVPRPAQKAGWKPSCPPSAAEPWLPVQIDGPCRVLSLSDIHIPYHSKEALEAAVKYGKKLKPDVVVILGDYQDFYRISRFQQDPKKRTLKEEIATGKDGLSWLRGQFPKARIIYKLGNHDERWNHYIWNKAVELWDLENLQLHNVLGFEDLGIERVDDNMILAGELPMFHGHELGRGISSPVNPARGMWLRGNHTILVGHYHRTSSHPETDIHNNEMMTWSQGCLCDRRPEFARVNRWNFGFAFVDVEADGQFNMQNLRISNDFQVRSA